MLHSLSTQLQQTTGIQHRHKQQQNLKTAPESMSQKINVATVTMDRNWKRTYLPQHLSLLSRGLSWSPGTSSDVVTLAIRVDLVIITAAKLFCCSLLHHLRLRRYLCVLAEVPGRVVLLWTRAFRDVEAVMQHDPLFGHAFVVCSCHKRKQTTNKRRPPKAATRHTYGRPTRVRTESTQINSFTFSYKLLSNYFYLPQYTVFTFSALKRVLSMRFQIPDLRFVCRFLSFVNSPFHLQLSIN